jgi:hypothetical protein
MRRFDIQAEKRHTSLKNCGEPPALPEKISCEEIKEMANRRRFIPTVIAAALMTVFLPLIASAQWGNNDRWGRGRNDNRYDNRTLRDAARRLESRSGDFQRHLDSALDRSRYDDTRREDNINMLAADFRNAASQFRNRVGDGRDLNRSSNEAQRLLNLGSRIDRLIGRIRLDSRTQSDWSQIRHDLRVIGDFFRGYYNGGYDNDRNRGRNTRDEWWRRLPF